MSDYNSSLPIRTEANGDAVIRLVDGTVTSQFLTINANGSLNIEQATAASLNATVVATDLDIRDLTSASDSVSVLQATPANLKSEVSQPTASLLNATVVQSTAANLKTTAYLNDGAGTAITSQANGGQRALDVGINVAGVQIDPRAIRALTSADTVTVVATDLDIRNLSQTQDSVKVGDGTDFLAVNADGSLNITDNGGSLTVDANNLDIRDLVFATDKVDATGSAVTVTNTVAVSATDLDIRDLAAATDSVSAWIKDATGTAFSATNPLPVSISADNAGTEVNTYNTASAVAGGATSNHDYTVTAGKTLLLTQVEASGSGKMKIEVQVESGVATGSFSTRFVQFNSTATPNMHIALKSPISIAAGVRVRVIRTNRDNQAQDLYSTISGEEV